MQLTPLFDAGPLITAHALAALVALCLGIWQMNTTKGTARHRHVGYVWVTLMAFVAASSFFIHEIRLLGPFSPIHILSILTLANLPPAVIAARRGNIKVHRAAMRSFFWLALVLTGAFTLLPGRVMHDVVF